MGSHSLPSPPAEDSKPRKSTSSSTKSGKPSSRVAKRPGLHTGGHQHDHHSAASSASAMDARHKRVWKACERCRMKKTKCDGEFPCKRCKDDGLVCTAGLRKKVEYKQLPKGYAEVLENTQFALIATVHKLYSMVRNSQQWQLGEPERNGNGQPVIHDIARMLGCIRPNSDVDLPVHSVFPEDEAGMAELARQLEAQQDQEMDTAQHGMKAEFDETTMCGTDRASSSELDHSDGDGELDYRKTTFGGGGGGSGMDQGLTVSPLSFSGNNDFDLDATGMFSSQSPSIANFPPWSMPKSTPSAMTMQQLMQSGALGNMDMLNQGLAESDFGTIKPHVLSGASSDAMMGLGDPMMYDGYGGEPMGL